jgi:hypothetical protein
MIWAREVRCANKITDDDFVCPNSSADLARREQTMLIRKFGTDIEERSRPRLPYCWDCGKALWGNEHYCGNCGIGLQPSSTILSTSGLEKATDASPLNRRRFLKYAGGTAVVVAASAVALYYASKLQVQTTMTTTSTTSSTPSTNVAGARDFLKNTLYSVRSLQGGSAGVLGKILDMQR